MSTELDPLLPQNEAAPEISGHGYRHAKRLENSEYEDFVVQDDDTDKGSARDAAIADDADGHDDLAILIRFLYNNTIYDPAFTEKFEKGGLEASVDLPRLKAGKVGGTFWSAFVPCPANSTDFANEAYTEQGLHQIGNSFSNLRLYYTLGVRYATLTHNCHNAFADAALVTNATGQTVASDPYWGGVSEFGRILLREMNRLGRPDKWAGSRAPVIFSHSSAFALCPHPRNVPDDVLDLVKQTNSLVMVNFSPDFISCVPSNSADGLPDLYPPNSTLHQVARHIRYIGDRIGYDHVGIGGDFDGILETPRGLEDVSKFPDLVRELLDIGVTDVEAAKLVGRNVLRVWKDAEAVSTQMLAEGVLPAEDKLGKLQF
ncbi:MAG: hypothetical protein Q9207_003088 [Kuettlingeria erythrocarpa]